MYTDQFPMHAVELSFFSVRLVSSFVLNSFAQPLLLSHVGFKVGVNTKDCSPALCLSWLFGSLYICTRFRFGLFQPLCRCCCCVCCFLQRQQILRSLTKSLCTMRNTLKIHHGSSSNPYLNPFPYQTSSAVHSRWLAFLDVPELLSKHITLQLTSYNSNLSNLRVEV